MHGARSRSALNPPEISLVSTIIKIKVSRMDRISKRDVETGSDGLGVDLQLYRNESWVRSMGFKSKLGIAGIILEILKYQFHCKKKVSWSQR